jgi:hypothetical protein
MKLWIFLQLWTRSPYALVFLFVMKSIHRVVSFSQMLLTVHRYKYRIRASINTFSQRLSGFAYARMRWCGAGVPLQGLKDLTGMIRLFELQLYRVRLGESGCSGLERSKSLIDGSRKHAQNGIQMDHKGYKAYGEPDNVDMGAGSHSFGVGIVECPAQRFRFPLRVGEYH